MADVRLIRPAERVPDSASGAMIREAAIAAHTVGAEHLWVGSVTLGPGMVSAVHHHGDSESGVFVVSGRARFASGDALTHAIDAGPGDFVWVPPNTPHVEMNLSDDEPVHVVVARSTQEGIVVNVAPPEGWSPEQARR